ncbi:nuclear transport factor 2 family protein [Streptomyces sp. DSM 40750]|uniref:nuclear transport factor 2 family protein n=1 Tax=Streptomyces sp. DSM 40750 TaxID=2801030 RepID=UPI00214C0CAC|nr:nuclear transport factor 2 family protein [Streptomyces sp. DSM 40750]UUU19637.1 nuclear transport factor 2 family protein [Streptomyces sp. DSM 40750]UUU27021.1 nuclear transport factor 2 family protein [Streptomyces sp. DSM 40750]
MKSRTLSRRVTVLGVGVLTTAALTVGATAFAGTGTPAKSSAAVASPASQAAKEARNKRVALAFVDLALNKKQPKKAADLYLRDPYIQHNPQITNGKKAFVTWATNFIKAVPDVKVDFKRVLADGDLVVIHSRLTTSATDRGTAVADIVRFKNGKIVEHWDVLQAVPETSANGNTMF